MVFKGVSYNTISVTVLFHLVSSIVKVLFISLASILSYASFSIKHSLSLIISLTSSYSIFGDVFISLKDKISSVCMFISYLAMLLPCVALFV